MDGDFRIAQVHGVIESISIRYVIPCRSRGCTNLYMVCDGGDMGRAIRAARDRGWRVRGIRAVCPNCLARKGRVSDSLRAFWRASDGLPPEVDLARCPYTCSYMTEKLYCTVFDVSKRCCHDACYSCEHFDGEREEE